MFVKIDLCENGRSDWKNMKGKNIVTNYIYNLLYQIIIIIIPIITTPYLSRTLGVENIGIYGYTISMVTYFTLVGALGISKYGQREIAYVQDDNNKRSIIFWELNIIRFFTVLMSSAIYIIAFCINGDYVLYYRILLLELLSVVMDISWFFQGIEDFKKVVIRNIIIKIIGLISIFIFVKTKNDLINYFIIYALSNVFGNISFWINIKKYIKKVPFNKLHLRKHIKPMISLFVPQIATSVYTILDKTILGMLGGDISEVGYYEQSQKIVKIALTFVTSMSIVMLPRMSNVYAKGDTNKITNYMKKSFTFDWFLSCPITFGIIAIANNFVPWFFGEGYDKVINLLIYSSPIVIFISLSTTIGAQFLTSIKKQNIHSFSVTFGAILNVLLNLILIPKIQSYGAIIATVIVEFVISFIEIVYIVRKCNIEIKVVTNNALKYIISSIIMCLIVSYISNYMKINAINTILQVIIGGIVYCIILLIIKDDWIMYMLKKIKNIKKKLTDIKKKF